MKNKTLLFIFIVMLSFSLKAQTNRNPVDVPIHPEMLSKSIDRNDQNFDKTRICIDTLRYPQMKEQLVNPTPAFHTFDLWAADAEQMSQTFLLSGASMSITGVEFFGRRAPTSTASLVVQVSIVNVDANNIPTTTIASQNITLTDTNFTYRQVTFSSAINVSNNYAVVIRPTSVGGILDFYVNNAVPAQLHDENLSRIRSNFLAGSGGNWVSIPVATASLSGGPYDFEMIVAPRVSYTITTNYTATPNPVCMQSSVSFTNTTTPSSILGHRMYSYYKFMNHFKGVPDSTYAYIPEPTASVVWSENTNHTYNAHGAITARLYSLGGLWANCADSSLQTITVHNLPSVSLALNQTFVCENELPFLISGGTPAGGTYSGNGVSLGEFSAQTAGIGTHTITYTYTDGNNCTSTATHQITVDACTKIVNSDSKESFVVSPNPTSDLLKISFNNFESETIEIQILSLDGKVVIETTTNNSNEMVIDVSAFSKGIYFVKVYSGKISMQTKFVVM